MSLPGGPQDSEVQHCPSGAKLNLAAVAVSSGNDTERENEEAIERADAKRAAGPSQATFPGKNRLDIDNGCPVDSFQGRHL